MRWRIACWRHNLPNARSRTDTTNSSPCGLIPRRHSSSPDTNSAAPFERVKQRWHDWIDGHVDHTLHLGETDPLIGFFREHEPARLTQIMTFQGDPTTEALAACFWLKLSAFIGDDGLPFTVREVRIEETPTNTVVVTRETFDPATCGLRAHAWPWRADMSINDL